MNGDFMNRAMQFFVSRGYYPEQAAGIVGNLYLESGGNSDALGDDGISYGLAQWNGDRLIRGLFKHTGTTNPSEDQQLDYVDYELRYSETEAYQALLQTQTPEDAAWIFCKMYERPGKPMLNSRIKYAQEAFKTVSS